MLDHTNIRNQLAEILPQIINAPGVNPEHPTYPGTATPYFQQFGKAGLRPKECQNARPLWYYMIEGKTDDRNSLDDSVALFTFRLGVLMAEPEGEFSLVHSFIDRLQAVFGRSGKQLEFTHADLTYHLAGELQTIATPWLLGSFGVFQSDAFNGTGFQEVNNADGCPMWRQEFVVRWTYYICNKRGKFRINIK